MSHAVLASERSYASEIPFRGEHEGRAKAFSALAVAFALMDMILPWLGMRLVHWRSAHVVECIAADVVCFSAMITYLSVYTKLSRRIALGGVDATSLDGVRVQIAAMLMNLLALGLILLSVGIFSR